MKARPAKLVMGKTNYKKGGFASEAGIVKSANASMQAIQEDLFYIIDQFEGATPEIMYDALEPTFEKSKVYCPKDTHALVNSGYLEIVSFRGKPKVEMGYGAGGNPSYTAYVHEMVEIPHQAPTQAKFLERAVNEDVGDIIDRVVDGYRRFMGS